MIKVGIKIVNTNGIGTKALDEGSVTQTYGAVRKRIDAGAGIEAGGATWLISEVKVSSRTQENRVAKSYATPRIWNRELSAELTMSEPLTTRGDTAKVEVTNNAQSA